LAWKNVRLKMHLYWQMWWWLMMIHSLLTITYSGFLMNDGEE
jgi:hypothetical protein